jgi:tetratricopeptide (TPR) repeat protein
VLHAQFINYDDNDYVTENPWVQGGLSLPAVAWAFKTAHSTNWHPLTWISHLLDTTLFGKGPVGPHAVNLGLHVGNTLLVFWLLRGLTGASWKSAVVAGLFGLHPLHVESVAWVAERKDVLSAFFGFLALLAYARYARAELKTQNEFQIQNSKLQTWHCYLMSLVLFALGLMSKPMLVTLPCVLLLLDFWPLRRLNSPRSAAAALGGLLLEKVPFFVLSAVSSAVTAAVQRVVMPSIVNLSFSQRIENALVCYSRYLIKTFWPTGLALPYLHPGKWPEMEVLASSLALLALSVGAWLARRKAPYVLTGWLWFLGMLVPVIGLVQVGIQAMADRYTYLPSIGIFIVVVWGIAAVSQRACLPSLIPASAATAALCLCAFLTRVQACYWHDSRSLFEHSAAVSPGNYVALANVGGYLFAREELDEAMDYYQRSVQINQNYTDAVNSIGAIFAAQEKAEAIEWFRRALELQPDHSQALVNMGNALAKSGHHQEAVPYFETALRQNPDDYRARNNYGNTLLKLKRVDDAIAQYRFALARQSRDPKLYANLAGALAAQGQFDEAILNYQSALRYQTTNDSNTHYSLGLALAIRNRWDEAIAQYQETIRLTPENPEPEYNLGYACRVQRRFKEAEEHLRRALELRPNFPIAHFNLGCVLADQGDKAGAIVNLQKALAEKPDYVEAADKLRAIEGFQ